VDQSKNKKKRVCVRVIRILPTQSRPATRPRARTTGRSILAQSEREKRNKEWNQRKESPHRPVCGSDLPVCSTVLCLRACLPCLLACSLASCSFLLKQGGRSSSKPRATCGNAPVPLFPLSLSLFLLPRAKFCGSRCEWTAATKKKKKKKYGREQKERPTAKPPGRRRG